MSQESPSSALIASGRTGVTCPTTGPYRSSRGARVTVFVLKGQRFPSDADGATTTWTLVSTSTASGA